ncbi:DUF2914 domain-containing protein [Formosa haliotis]|uniref:DUF2914 domain-containing protein n=1 Tax=Formosa haliotis TaxID=1555194 RepID=UPI000B06CE47
MSTNVFILSGIISLVITLLLIIVIYKSSPSTRSEIHLGKMLGLVALIYGTINLFYFFNLIPPVPLALEDGMVAHSVKKENNKYVVAYESDKWYVFWRAHKFKYNYSPGEEVYVFTSIFAPTDIKKSIFHRWKWYNTSTQDWEVVDEIGYDITGGRDAGYRGYTYKSNVKPGLWKVEVVTEEGLILGIINFDIITRSPQDAIRVIQKTF